MRIFVFLIVLCPTVVFSQKLDHWASFRNISSNSYFRLNYDNDYFNATDRNYTQGYSFEMVLPILEKNPINKLLLTHKDNSYRYGFTLEHFGYTPDHYESPDIQKGDRPFSATILLKSFVLATNEVNKSRTSTSLSLGLIGPGAFGKEMQVAIHKATGNKIPLGWQHQIKNDVVVNYGLHYEIQLFRYRNLWSLQGLASANLGTLFTNASVGMNSVFGILNNPFAVNGDRAFKLYAFAQPSISIVGYDATLQGGVFNRSSPYVIESSEINRVTGQLNFGVILQTRSLYFEYTRSYLSKEFESGEASGWGGVKIGFTF
ncbi:lipid A deacylase LpxR family protein [Gelidibacter salicanalis]|uniref:Lipid A deacylase LpxR family protein n=1 Tax=Gelidibacter salicanalis TaxID=291193 RepID=A0A5C7APB8_9FLAO|nr:lipid A deacylase LpxR family protein [Gelidibacter salicanalis]